ncbi:MAG: OmpA family protein [Pseudomonadota bacterium]
MSMKMIPLALAATLTLTACTDPARIGSEDTRKRDSGALVGGIAGGVLGALIGDSEEEKRRGALIGAAVGAGAGAAIGNNLDKQEAELRESLNNETSIVNNGSSLVVTLPQDVLFAVDSAVLRPDLETDIRTLGASLLRYPNSAVDVIGHTDNTGDAAYNQGLSQRRADAVRNVLVSSGVSFSRVNAIGAGENTPVATNLTPEGRAKNRRVEFVIRPTN